MKTSAPARAASPLASTSLPTASKVRRFHAQGGTRQTRPRSVVRLATLARPWVRERQICSVLGRKLPQFRDLQRHVKDVAGADFDLLRRRQGSLQRRLVRPPRVDRPQRDHVVVAGDESAHAELPSFIAPGDGHAGWTRDAWRRPLPRDQNWPADRLIATHHGARDRAGLVIDDDGQLVSHGAALERYDVATYRGAVVVNPLYVIPGAKPEYGHRLLYRPHSLDPELPVGRGQNRHSRAQGSRKLVRRT